MKRLFQLFLRGAFSIVLLYLVFTRFDIQQFKGVIQSARVVYIVAAWICVAGAVALNAYKWQRLIGVIGGLRISFANLLRYQLIGFFYSFFVPGGQVVGEVMKAVRITNNEQKKKEITFSIFLDRATGFIALGALLAVVFLLNPVLWRDSASIAAIAVGAGIALIGSVLFLSRFGSLMINAFSSRFALVRTYIQESYELYKARVKEINIAIILSCCIHIGMALSILFIIVGLGFSISFSYLVWLYLVTGIVLFLPVAYAGFGAREWVFVYFLGLQHVSFEAAITASFLFAAVNMGVALIGLVFELKKIIS